VHSDRVEVTDGEGNDGVAVFERGPRTVQPSSARGLLDDLVLYELITHLGLTQEMDVVSKADWSKLKRFVFYPDHLVAMPSLPSLGAGIPGLQRAGNEMLHILQDLLTEPVFAGFARAAFNVFWKQVQIRRAQAPHAGFTYSSRADGDDSIGHFFARYLGGPELVDNVLSAMVHGIYGGDVWKISVQSSLFGKFYAAQTAIAQSRGAPFFDKEFDIVRIGDMALGAELVQDKAVVAMAKRSLGWGGINFAGGFSVLTDAMVQILRRNPNVQFRLGKDGRVQNLRYDETKSQVQVCSIPLTPL
jgi:protoporphyrinogen oxidase